MQFLVSIEFDRLVFGIIVYSMNYNTENSFTMIPEVQVERFQELIYQLYQCCQKRIQHQSEQFDLPDAELRCLRLFGQERYLTPKGIAHQMGVVRSRITKIINGLGRRDLIRRFKDPEDSRVTLLRLTPKGQKKLDLINASLASANTSVLARMTPEQRSALLAHLDVLRASMEAVGNEIY